MDQSTGDLIGRLSRLELQQAKLQRSNKHLRMMTGALMLVCGALFTMAQTSSAVPDTLEAQQFLLRDSGTGTAHLLYYHCKDGRVQQSTVGYYTDKLRKTPAGWRFASRQVTILGHH